MSPQREAHLPFSTLSQGGGGQGDADVSTVGTVCCGIQGTTGGLRGGGAGTMGALASEAEKVRQQADKRHECSVGAISRASKSQDNGSYEPTLT